MNGKMKHFGLVVLLVSFLLAGLIVLNGCKKSEPAAPPEPTPPVAPVAPK